ncbi:hypothetical protein ACWD4X_01610 [Streptomyces termitum]
MRRLWAALTGGAAVAATIVAATLGASEPAKDAGGAGSDRSGTSVARVEFVETAPLDTDPSLTGKRKVELFAEHRGDAVHRLRFLVTLDGRVAEERLWRADRPDTMAVRDWGSCTSVEEAVPDPRPDSLRKILDEYFGPADIPAGASRLPDGTRRWETPTGMMRVSYTDLGGAYPHRIVEIKGPDGSVGSTISDTRLGEHPSLPAWRADWPSCRPSAPAS